MASMHVNDVGTAIIIQLVDQDSQPITLVGYTLLRMLLKLPSGSTLSRTGVLFSDGTDGKVKYLTVDGDLPEPGNYRFQAYVELPAGKWHSDDVKQKVEANLD